MDDLVVNSLVSLRAPTNPSRNKNVPLSSMPQNNFKVQELNKLGESLSVIQNRRVDMKAIQKQARIHVGARGALGIYVDSSLLLLKSSALLLPLFTSMVVLFPP